MAIESRKADGRDDSNEVADRAARVTAAAFLERLPQMLDGLREIGFSVGVEQHLAVDELLIGLASRKAFPLEDPTVFGRLICPLFAKSPVQQEIFDGHFKDWLSKLPTTVPDTDKGFRLWLPEKKTEESSNGATGHVDSLRHRYSFSEQVGIFILAVVFFVITIWGIDRFLYPKPPPRIRPSQDAETDYKPNLGIKQSTATQPEVQAHRPRDHRKKIRLEFIWVAVGSGAFLVLLAFLRRRDETYLQRKLAGAIPKTGSLHLRLPAPSLYKSNFVARSSYDLRRSRLVNQDRLDPEATVQASVRACGFLTPVSFRQHVVPEYLVLIDRRHFRDQSTALTEGLLSRLAEDRVGLSVYYFDRSANFCFPRIAGTQRAVRSVSINELADRYSDARLLVFADLENILQPGSRDARYWVQRLAEWESPAVFVRRSDDLAQLYQDVLQILGFSVFPATEGGLRSYADFVNENTSERSRRGEIALSRFRTIPDVLENESTWLGHREPDPARVDSMLASLKQSLGSSGFLCLSACAIYPEIKWKLTTYLAREICRIENFNESPEEILGRLCVLPWFRYARMPDWLRLRLISFLDPKHEKIMRRIIEDLFLSASDVKVDSRTIFQIASQDPWFRSKVLRLFFRPKSTRPVVDPLNDYVFATFMRNKLSFRLPKAVQHLVVTSHLNSLWHTTRWLSRFLAQAERVLTKLPQWTTEARLAGRLDGSSQSRMASKKDNLSAAARYVTFSLVCFVTVLGLAALLKWYQNYPPPPGLLGNLFYILLLSLGLAASGFLFGVLRSYERFSGKLLGGVVSLGGPIVIFVLVVIGGFVLTRNVATFAVTVYVRGKASLSGLVLANSGDVVLDLGTDRLTQPIAEGGKAYFPAIPATFRGQEASIGLESDAFELADRQQKYRLGSGNIYLSVQRKSAHFSGRVQDDKWNPIPGAVIDVAGLKTTTDSTGHFQIVIPSDRLRADLDVEVAASNYAPVRLKVVPNANVIIQLSRLSEKPDEARQQSGGALLPILHPRSHR
jgi:hypothetical protein